MIIYGDWSIQGRKPSGIVSVQVNLPTVTLHCVALPKPGKTPLDEVKAFMELAKYQISNEYLLNKGTYVQGDRGRDLLNITDGVNIYKGMIEPPDYQLDKFSDEIIEYTLTIHLELPSDVKEVFKAGAFSPSSFNDFYFHVGGE
ncbi:MAG: hypothetical protein ACPLJI_08950 [Methanothermobacter sp.]|uniref:hypothetical protein n=1 Tax=Methanothermobacter sp. TaxID=1884223 RepID=UPI003C73C021